MQTAFISYAVFLALFLVAVIVVVIIVAVRSLRAYMRGAHAEDGAARREERPHT
jgi:hypothetical protein